MVYLQKHTAFLVLIPLLLNSALLPLSVVAETSIIDESPITLEKAPQQKQQLQLSAPVSIVDDATTFSQGDLKRDLSDEDQANLNSLWGSLLRQNPTIQFALKQLNVPMELRNRHKSLMAKSMGALLSGVGMIPYAVGANTAAIGSSIAAGNIADRMFYKDGEEVKANELPTDAELVALSQTVDVLRRQLLENYFSYKQALQSFTNLKAQRQTLNRIAPAVGTAVWQQQLMRLNQQTIIDGELLKAKQEGENAYWQLARLVGPEALEALKLEPLSQHETWVSTIQANETIYQPHLQALWNARLGHSATIMLALQKLDEKTGKIKKKDQTRWRKGLLSSMVQLGSLGTAAVTGSSAPMIGGNVLGNLVAPNATKERLETVTNADMVMLVKAVDDEQTSLFMRYLHWRQALEAKQLALHQQEQLTTLSETLAQDDPKSVGQFFGLNALMAQKVEQAEQAEEKTRHLLEASTNMNVVRELAVAIAAGESLVAPEAPDAPDLTPLTLPQQ